MPAISRRAVLLGTASLAAMAYSFAVPAVAASITLEQFRGLSARLTGFLLSDLNAAGAGQLLDSLIGLGRGPDLTRLAAAPGMGGSALADDIVAAWYSGRYETEAGPASFGLPHALLWHALDFTKPPGLCGNAPASWAEPPEI
jgi:hypothetical protein